MESPFSTIPLTPDHRRQNAPEALGEITPDLGPLVSFGSAAKSSILLDNPGSIGFRAVRNAMADFYASDLGRESVGTGFSEGKITEEEFKALYHSRHPGMIGKWKEGMSHLRADYMMGDLELRDELDWKTSFDNNPWSAVSGGLVGGLVDPTTALTFGGGASTSATLSAARRLGYNGVQRLGMASSKLRGAATRGFFENAVTELPTGYVQEKFLKEDRTLADTLTSLTAGAVLPVGLELGGVALNRALKITATTRREDLVRAAMGEKLPDDLGTNLKANAEAATQPMQFDEHVKLMEDHMGTLEADDRIAQQYDRLFNGHEVEGDFAALKVDLAEQEKVPESVYIAAEAAGVYWRRGLTAETFIAEVKAVHEGSANPTGERVYGTGAVPEGAPVTAKSRSKERAKNREIIAAYDKRRAAGNEDMSGEGIHPDGKYDEGIDSMTRWDSSNQTVGESSVSVARSEATLDEVQSGNSTRQKKNSQPTPGEQWAAKKARQINRNRKIEAETKASAQAAAARQAQSLVDDLGGAKARRNASISSDHLISRLHHEGSRAGKQTGNWIKFWNEFVGRTGREVRYFDPKDSVQNALFGNGRGAAHISDAGTVYVAIDQLNSFHQLSGVIGHEIGHTVMYRSFTEWDNVVSTIVNSGDPAIGKMLRESLDEFSRSPGFSRMSKAKQMDEAVANVFGQVFQSKTFWKQYADMHGATAFQRLSEFIRRVIRDIHTKVKGHGPDIEKSIGDLYKTVIHSVSAASDGLPKDVALLNSQRAKIHDEYGSRFWGVVNNLDDETMAALAEADAYIDANMTELPQEAGDPKSYVTNYGKLKAVGSGFFIPLQSAAQFRQMSPKERRSAIQGLLVSPEYKKVYDRQMALVQESWDKSVSEGAGETGAPLITYQIQKGPGGKDGVRILFNYGDTGSSIKPRIEQSFSHSRALIQEWLSEFGYDVRNDEGDFASGLTKAAQELRFLAGYARDRFFYGNIMEADKAYINSHEIDPMVQEFFDSREFKELFDDAPVSSSEATPDKSLSNLLQDSFVEAVSSFRNRKMNELADDMESTPVGVLGAWQDRIKEFTENRHQFMTDAEIEAVQAKIGLNFRAKEAGRPSHAQMFGQVMESFLRSLHEARDNMGKLSTQKVVDPVTLDAPTLKALEIADQEINFAKEAFGYTFAGNLDDVRARLANKNSDWREHSYAAAIDTPSSFDRIPLWIAERHFGNAPEKGLYGPNTYLDMMDTHAASVFDDIAVQRGNEIAQMEALLSEYIAKAEKSLDGPSKEAKAAFERGRKAIEQHRQSFNKDIVEIDGVRHTRLEHEAFRAMKEVWGDALFNRWISWDSAKERIDSMDKATLAEYARRRSEDSKRTALEGGRSVESRVTDMTPGKQDVNELKAQSAEARSALDENPFHTTRDMLEAEKALDDANTDINPMAAQTYAEGLDNMARPEDLVRQIDENRQNEIKRLAPFLKDPVAALKAKLPVFFPGGGKASTLSALVTKAETTAFYMKDRTKALTDQVANGQVLSRTLIDGSPASERVKSAGKRALLEGKSQAEALQIINDVSNAEADHLVNVAKLNYSKVAEKVALGTFEQLYTSMDGQLRRAGKTLKEKLWNGKVLSSGSTLDTRMNEARTNVTFGINKALDDIPDLGMTGKAQAGMLKQAVAAMRGGDLSAVPSELRPLFTKLGQEIGTGLELARGYINEAGGNIAKNSQFLFSMRHDLSKIRRDPGTWKARMVTALDWNKTELNAGLAKGSLSNTKARSDFLDNMLAEIETANRSPESHPFNADLDNLATRDLHHRVLSFMDDNTMIDYDVDFGSGDPMVELISQLNGRAERAVMMQEFGPNYRENFSHVLDALRDVPTHRGARLAYQLQERNMKIAFDGYAGLLNNPVNQRVAEIGQYVRLAANAAWGWMSTPSSMTDIAGLSKELRFSGATKYTNLFGRYLKDMATGSGDYSPEVKALFQGNLAGTEAILSAHTRMNVGAGEKGFVANTNKWIFTKNGQRRHTMVLQYAFTDLMGNHFGDMARAVKSGEDIGPGFRRWLSTYKIDEADFANMAEHVDDVQLRASGEAKAVLLPSMIKDKALRDKLAFALKDSMDYAVLQPSGSDVSLLTFGLRSGTVMGEAVRCISQYKGFAMAMNRKNRRRWRAYELDPDSMGTRRMHQAAYGAHLLAMGLLATQLKDVMAGKEPLTFAQDDQQNWDNLHRVVMQAGLFTVMQDLGVSVANDQQDGWSLGLSSMALGPMPGQALRFADQLTTESNGGLARAARTAVNTTPFASLPLWNTLKHVMVGNLVSDAYQIQSDSIVRFGERRSGQENFLDN